LKIGGPWTQWVVAEGCMSIDVRSWHREGRLRAGPAILKVANGRILGIPESAEQ
jgi:hypothetical protein